MFDDSQVIERKAQLSAVFTTLGTPVWTRSFIDLNELIDEIDLV